MGRSKGRELVLRLSGNNLPENPKPSLAVLLSRNGGGVIGLVHSKMLTSSAIDRDLAGPVTKGLLKWVLKDGTGQSGVNKQPVFNVTTFERQVENLIFVRWLAESAL